MLSKEFAQRFAIDWIGAWNTRDLPRVLDHYTDDVEMASPYIAAVTGEQTAMLTGKEKVAAYWERALERFPQLKFEHQNTLVGTQSITIVYKGVNGLAAEVFFFNDDLKIHKASAHYL